MTSVLDKTKTLVELAGEYYRLDDSVLIERPDELLRITDIGDKEKHPHKEHRVYASRRAIKHVVEKRRLELSKNHTPVEVLQKICFAVEQIAEVVVNFDRYEYEIDEELEIAVNLDNLKQVLRRAKPADFIIIELLESKLKITLKGTSERVFTLSLINLSDDERQKVPALDFKSRIEIPSNLFNEAIEDMDVVSDSVAFEVKDKTFSVQAAGNLSTAKVSFKENDNLVIESKDNVRSRYSVEYLKKIIKGSKLNDMCLIWLGNEYPLKIEYRVMDKVVLSTILAPRVSND